MNRLQRTLDIVLLLAGLVAVWQLTFDIAGDTAISSPLDTVVHLAKLLKEGRLWPDLMETFYAFAWALLFSYLLGIGVGVWFGAHRRSMAIGEPILLGFYAVPKVTLFPIVLLLFGLGPPAKIAFGAIHGFVPVAIFTMNAICNTRPIYIKVAQTMHLSPKQIFFSVLLPSILPELFSGARIGFSLALLGVLIGEMFASKRGLGFVAMNSINLADPETMMSVALLLFTTAVIANTLFLWLDHWLHARMGADIAGVALGAGVSSADGRIDDGGAKPDRAQT